MERQIDEINVLRDHEQLIALRTKIHLMFFLEALFYEHYLSKGFYRSGLDDGQDNPYVEPSSLQT